ncbi:MAG: hypothetical protein O3A55_03025 [Bacteroidetes bacterium]|nr:hypothetical protein [Bacteroidota bacterium]
MKNKFLKILSIITGVVIVLIIGIFLVTKTEFFYSIIRNNLVSNINKTTNGKMQIDNISGNIFTGIILSKVDFKNQEKSIIVIDKVNIGYNIFDVISGDYKFSEVEFTQPKIYLIKDKEGKFNYDNLFKKSDQSTNYKIDQLIINNGELNYFDEAKKNNRVIKNLSTESFVQSLDENLRIEIKSLNLLDKNSKVNIKSAVADINILKNNISVNNIKIETDKSNLSGSLLIDDFKGKNKTNLIINYADLNFDEVSKLINYKIPITGNVIVKSEVLLIDNIQKLKNTFIKYNESEFNINVELTNLQKNNKTIAVTIDPSKINLQDFSTLLPKYKEYLNEVNGLLVNGEILYSKNKSELNLEIDKNNQKLFVQAKSNGNNLENITFDINGKDVGLSDYFGKNYPSSSLNFTAKVNLLKNNFIYSVELEPSIYNLIKIDTANINGTFANNILSGNFAQKSNTGELEFLYYLNYNKLSGVDNLFTVSGKFEKVNLEKILIDSIHNSTLNGTFNFTTKGLDIDDALIEGDIKFNNSKYNRFYFDTSTILLTLGKKNKLWEYTFRSRFADATFIGDFSPRLLQHSFKATYQQITNLLNSKKQDIYNSMGIAQNSKSENVESTTQNIFNFGRPQKCDYRIKINNFEPLTMLFELPPSTADAKIEGKLQTYGNKLTISGITEILVARSTINDKKLYLDNFKLNYFASNVNLNNNKNMELDIIIESSLDAIYYGENKYENVNLEFDLKQNKSRFLISATIDKDLSGEVQGGILFSKNDISATLNSIYLRYGTVHLNNNKPLKLYFSKEGVKIPMLALYESNDENIINPNNAIYFNGNVSKEGNINSVLEIKNLNTTSLLKFFDKNNLFTNVKSNALLKINGTLIEPEITSSFNINWNSENSKSEDKVIGYFNFKNKISNLNIEHYSSVEKNKTLSINGSIPINLSLLKPLQFIEENLNLNISLNNFNANYFESIFTDIKKINGKISGGIVANGTIEKPELVGEIKFKNFDFIYMPNGLKYFSNGNLLFQKNIIRLANFDLSNDKNDYSKSNSKIIGQINFEDLKNPNYNITAIGELMIMQHSNTSLSDTYYGDLILATLPEGLHFEGGSGKSKMFGKLLVRNANLIIPPSETGQIIRQSKISNIIVVDDTSKKGSTNLAMDEMLNFLQQRLSRAKEVSLLNDFVYDLQFQTDGIVSTRFIFNPATNEEMVAYLDGNFSLRNTNKLSEMFGTINVSQRSTYTFYKQFNASGSLEFNGDASNPNLKIIALYTSTRLKSGKNIDQTTEDVHVQLEINGTRNQPIPKLSLYQVDEEKQRVERTVDVEGDVISFLLTSSPGIPGKFREDLNLNDKEGISEVLGNTVSVSMMNTFTNTLLSGMMMDFVRANNITFISSAELRYSTDTPDLRLGGEVLDAYWSFGGKVFSDINNANLSLQMPLSSITGNRKYKNFVFEVERKIYPIEYNIDRQSIFGARIYYKIIF